jgi:2-(1,2-epoxy-1,2-dihydrophenyl)acetyl-CoA isomerase
MFPGVSYGTLRYDVDNGLATITLSRPERRNALDLEQTRDLADVATRCGHDPAVRAVLLLAEGTAFHVGADLRGVAEADDPGLLVKQLTGGLHLAMSRFARMPAPLVVGVQGVAAGGGFSLAIAGDVVVAARSATFALAYGAAGLVPDGGSTWQLPRLIGLRRTQELVYLDRRLTAAEAADWGLVTEVVDDDALTDRATEIARRLAAGPTSALGRAKALLRRSYAADLEGQLEDESEAIAAAAGSADGRAGVAAFLGKTSPAFEGS